MIVAMWVERVIEVVGLEEKEESVVENAEESEEKEIEVETVRWMGAV